MIMACPCASAGALPRLERRIGLFAERRLKRQGDLTIGNAKRQCRDDLSSWTPLMQMALAQTSRDMCRANTLNRDEVDRLYHSIEVFS